MYVWVMYVFSECFEQCLSSAYDVVYNSAWTVFRLLNMILCVDSAWCLVKCCLHLGLSNVCESS